MESVLTNKVIEYVATQNNLKNEQVEEMWKEYYDLIMPTLDMTLPIRSASDLKNINARTARTSEFFQMKVTHYKKINESKKNPNVLPKKGKKGRK